jgi:hypothetical protein
MAFKAIMAQVVQTGKTVQLPLTQLRGPKGAPVLHVEYLGETNTSYWLDVLSRAKADAATAHVTAGRRHDLTPAEMAARLRDQRAKKRDVVALHAVRDVENLFHDDGTPATKADIQDFVKALPDDVFDVVWMFAEDANNFRETPVMDEPAAIAGK